MFHEPPKHLSTLFHHCYMTFSVAGIEIRSFGKKLKLMPEIRDLRNQVFDIMQGEVKLLK